MSYNNKKMHLIISKQDLSNFNLNISDDDFLKFVLNMEEELNTTNENLDFLNANFNFSNENISYPNKDTLDFHTALSFLEDNIKLDNPQNPDLDTLCYGKYKFEVYKKKLENLSREAKQKNSVLANLLSYFEVIQDDLFHEIKQINQLLINFLLFYEAIK